MGSVTILSSLGAGHYKVRINFDNVRVEARKTFIAETISGLLAKQNELEAKKAPLVVLMDEAEYFFNLYLQTAPIEEIIADQSILDALTMQAFNTRTDVERVDHEIKRLKLVKSAIEKELVNLEKTCPNTIDVNAWCIEYKEDLTGTLESIEVDYCLERDPITNQIRNDTGVWLPGTIKAPTNQLQHILEVSSYATWVNLCMLPAAQKFKGLYRIATIIRIDYDTNQCDFYLDSIYSVDPNINKLIDKEPIVPVFEVYGAQQIEYRDAPINYMGGGAETFLVGDKVIVDLHAGVGVPTVIGYYNNPRQGTKAFLLATNNDNYPQHWDNGSMEVIDLLGFCNLQDMVTNADKYTIAFGAASAVHTEDANVIWDHATYHNIRWMSGNSSINIVNNTLVTPYTGGLTETDYLYHLSNITNEQDNINGYSELYLFLADTNEITIFKDGIEQTHITIYPQGTSSSTKTAMIINQTGIALLSELPNSAQKGYFKFTGSYVHDWTV